VLAIILQCPLGEVLFAWNLWDLKPFIGVYWP
jgi:hypothetical protein